MDEKKKCAAMYQPVHLSTAPIIYGRTHEKIALRKFTEATGYTVAPTGLFIHPQYNFLAGVLFQLLFIFNATDSILIEKKLCWVSGGLISG